VCWRIALESRKTPCAILLTRQDVPALSPAPGEGHPAEKGAYVLRSSESPKAVIVATGSEVGLAVEAQAALASQSIAVNVVSMPSWFLFEQQSEAYRASVFPKGLPCVSVEAAATLGWQKYAQAHVGIDHFGASAPAERLFEEFGFTVENVVAKVKGLL
jgi:transketolase